MPPEHGKQRLIKTKKKGKKKTERKKRKPGSLPPYVPCSNPHPLSSRPPCPHLSAPTPSFSLRCASGNRTSGRDLLRMNCVSDVCESASVFVRDRREFRRKKTEKTKQQHNISFLSLSLCIDVGTLKS